MKYQYLGTVVASVLATADVAGASGLPTRRHNVHRSAIGRRSVDPAQYPQYPPNNISMPLDHFKNDSRYAPHSDAFFNNRYWFDASHYKKGGPVIVLHSGWAWGPGGLPVLEKGILSILAKATGGIGVILEQRYFGYSYPSDLQYVNSTTLRFLSTEQAMADMAYFARNVVFPGHEHINLTAPGGTPFIAYGGSYAGGVVAFTRKTYPDAYWGAISSSGQTRAEWNFWKYWEAVRLFSPTNCAELTTNLTDVLDNILMGMKGTEFPHLLRNLYGLDNVTADVDFAYVLSSGIERLEFLNWDPHAPGTTTRYLNYCNNVTAPTLLFPELANRTADVQKLLEAGGHGSNAGLATAMLNHAGYVLAEDIAYWEKHGGNYTQDQWFAEFDPASAQDDSIQSLGSRALMWQICTEWGYLQPISGTPLNVKPLASRLLDLEYTARPCRYLFNRTQEANVTIINQYGGFDISYPRLALLDGTRNPWRGTGPQALDQPARTSTTDQPWILLEGGVVHWDMNGANATETTPTYPPAFVQAAQAQEVDFVKSWLVEFAAKTGAS